MKLTHFSLILFIFYVTLVQQNNGRKMLRDNKYWRTARDLRRSPLSEVGCQATPTKRVYHNLNDICEQCYQLYRDLGVYDLCRSNCFGTDYFRGCMDALLVDDKQSLVNMVENIH